MTPRSIRERRPVAPGGSPGETIDQPIEAIERWCARVAVPRRRSDIGVTAEPILAIARDAFGNRMRGNPAERTESQAAQVLRDLPGASSAPWR